MLYLECAEQFLRLPQLPSFLFHCNGNVCVVLCDLRASEAGDIET